MTVPVALAAAEAVAGKDIGAEHNATAVTPASIARAVRLNRRQPNCICPPGHGCGLVARE
jgi:hypothetical protein